MQILDKDKNDSERSQDRFDNQWSNGRLRETDNSLLDISQIFQDKFFWNHLETILQYKEELQVCMFYGSIACH